MKADKEKPFVVRSSPGATCGGGAVLTLDECKAAVHFLKPGAKLHREEGADYGGPTVWPKGCFLRSDNMNFFFNTGGTWGTPTQSLPRRICKGPALIGSSFQRH